MRDGEFKRLVREKEARDRRREEWEWEQTWGDRTPEEVFEAQLKLEEINRQKRAQEAAERRSYWDKRYEELYENDEGNEEKNGE